MLLVADFSCGNDTIDSIRSSPMTMSALRDSQDH